MEMKKVSNDIKGRRQQIALLEREIDHATLGSQVKVDKLELSPVMVYVHFSFRIIPYSFKEHFSLTIGFLLILQSYTNLLEQLTEKSFELEVWKQAVLLAFVCSFVIMPMFGYKLKSGYFSIIF
jgi:hypothetical protein